MISKKTKADNFLRIQFLLIVLLSMLNLDVIAQQFDEILIVDCDPCAPSDVCSVDLNADNFQDILFASTDGILGWYENIDGESFSNKIIIATDLRFLREVASHDIDNDGDEDVLAATAEGFLYLYLNNGLGEFSLISEAFVDMEIVTDMMISDLDGDELIDVVFVGIPDVVWFKNLGNMQFSSEVLIPEEIVQTIALADLDDDEDIDIIYSSAKHDVISWFVNDGSGNFAIDTIGTTPFLITSLFIGDFNGDDEKDILASSDREDETIWYENLGNESYAKLETISVDNNVFAHAIDADNDGDLDILADFPFGSDGLYWIENAGSGEFNIETNFPVQNVVSYASAVPWVFVNADFNNDGYIDILYCDRLTDAIGVYRNKGEGQFEDVFLSVHPIELSVVITDDIDLDGDIDIISASRIDNKISIFENLRFNNFRERVINVSNNTGRRLTKGDFDGDGDIDLLSSDVSLEKGKIAWLRNEDNASNFTEIPIPSDVTVISGIEGIDFDLDGDIDIVYKTTFQDHHVGWHENLGGGEFSEARFLFDLAQNQTIANADLNGDSLLDFIWKDDNIGWYRNMGNGEFSGQIIDSLVTNPRLVYPVDFDLDGDIDILMSPTEGRLYWYENLDSGIFAEKQLLIPFPDQIIVDIHVVDIDFDADNDILISYIRNGTDFFCFENLGDGRLAAKDVRRFRNGVDCIQAADFDGDRDIDILGCSDNAIFIFEDISNQSLIKGNVFWDDNNNGVKDSLEFGIAKIALRLQQNGRRTFTNDQGDYQFSVFQNRLYDIEVFNTECWQTTNDSIIQDIPVLIGEEKVVNIGMNLIPDASSASIYMTSSPTRCGFSVPFWLTVENDGCNSINGVYGFVLNPLVEFNEFVVAPDIINGDTVLWEFNNLGPSETIERRFSGQISGVDAIGEFIEITSLVYTINQSGQTTLLDSYDFLSEIRCAYDPNDKLNFPARENLKDDGFDKNYTLFEEELEYIIRFQNTGNDTAFNVEITDRLDPNLDIETFQLIDYSHMCAATIENDGFVKFKFENILLPDSITNEPLSHGYVRYHISSKNNLEENTNIENTANIFFDFNPPIITNTANNLMVSSLPVTTNTNELFQPQNIQVYPNPSNGNFVVEFPPNLKIDHTLIVIDINGQLISSNKLDNNINRFENTNMNDGLYFYYVKNNKGSVVSQGKIVKF